MEGKQTKNSINKHCLRGPKQKRNKQKTTKFHINFVLRENRYNSYRVLNPSDARSVPRSEAPTGDGDGSTSSGARSKPDPETGREWLDHGRAIKWTGSVSVH